ncbi:MAG TPA: apolipoprotein N-acyltransferase [Allosphingosinicella sp.]|jgi:apolipoprotein N-acyltransferase|uniref:apolipoprotein N-acyltransferase n=1 Tax=Allosphingosinicella sp. TaxID=2823234 RepID=UPI002F29FCD4
MKPLLFAFLLGLASACGFEPLKLWPLTILAFAGLIWLVDSAPSLRSALARGYWFAMGQFVLGLNWIATAFIYQDAMPHWLGWIAVVLLSFYLAVYPAMATGLAWRWGRGVDSFRLVLIFAAAWIVTEWLRATMFTGFAWNPVGVALLPTPLARSATLVGTYGLSGLLILIGGLVLLLVRREWRASLGLAAGAAAVTGAAILLTPATLPPTNIPLRIVQPNIGQEGKWTEAYADFILHRLGELSRRPNQPAILLWPEAAVTDSLEDGRDHPIYQADVDTTRRLVQQQMGMSGLLLTGGVTIRSANGVNASSATNSIFAIDSSRRILGRYDKAHLVPYGEYLPMRPLLSAIGLSRLAPGNLDFDPGPGPQTLDLPLIGKAGFQLCYEIIFSGEVVDRENRPAFLFNPSNDAWFGPWGPPQHLAQARLRGLEEGLPVLRSTPTGISTVVDAEGALLASLPLGRAGIIDTDLPAPKPPTLFARFGNVLPFAFALLLVGAAWLSGRARPVAKRAEAG